ncbi:Small ubiquitin-related modifier 2 [Pseudocercospora fuligena]|uniref:Small ubiquitin-related modifier 2 n=1 Tax=Pseudocercospora fuligena TaxID=685502 RepID=A0A8H6RP92_9PEZI|nr:Small ubiquitin-related modifier 2 [Pseudocercospora fuligena]
MEFEDEPEIEMLRASLSPEPSSNDLRLGSVVVDNAIASPPATPPMSPVFDFPGRTHYSISERDRHVSIIIKNAADNDGCGMTFKLKYHDTFKNAFNHFRRECCTTCVPLDDLRFKSDKVWIDENDTPKKLDLWHNTTTQIRAFSNLTGLQCTNCKKQGYPAKSEVIEYPKSINPPTQVKKPEATSLIMKDQTGFTMNLRLSSTSTVQVLKDTYADRALRDVRVCKFLYDGERLMGAETPEQLGLVDGDCIDVFVEQIGG